MWILGGSHQELAGREKRSLRKKRVNTNEVTQSSREQTLDNKFLQNKNDFIAQKKKKQARRRSDFGKLVKIQILQDTYYIFTTYMVL